MSGLTITLTNAGRAALINAEHTGTAPVTITQVGVTASAFDPAPTATTVPGEIKRLNTISGKNIAADTVHITIRDDSTASYTLRGFGLYLNDGTLFAVYSQSAAVMQKSAQSLLLLSVDIKLLQVAASSVTFGNANFLNPPATTSVQGVIELATNNEAKAGTDSARAITPATLKTVLDTRLPDDMAGKVDLIKNAAEDISEKLPSGFYQQNIKTNGWPVPGTSWWHLLSLTNANPNSYYALQFACAFSGETVYVRSTKGDGNTAWRTLWHSGNFDPATKLGTSGGTSTGNLKIERASARVILKSTEETGREIAIISNGSPNVGFRDETNGGQWLFRIDGHNNIALAGNMISTVGVQALSTGNAVYFLRDDAGVARGVLSWTRANDCVMLYRYNSETGLIQGWLRINADATITTGGAITAPEFKGKATSADKLNSSTTINGTSFNGTADIITSRWGAERTLKIGNTGKAVNGTGNVTWSLAEIGAAPASHSHGWGDVTGKPATATRWPKWGEVDDKPDTFTPSAHGHTIANVTGLQDALASKANNAGQQYTGLHHFHASQVGWGVAPAHCIRVEMGDASQATWLITGASGSQFKGGVQMLDTGSVLRLYTIGGQYAELNGSRWNKASIPALDYLPLTGGTLTGNLKVERSSARVILKSTEETGREIAIISNGTPSVGFRDETNGGQWLFRIAGNNTAYFLGTIKAPEFDGNATSADKLKTARTLKIGDAEKSFDGTGNLTWSPAELGYSSAKSANGWMKRPDGIIEQWGVYLQTTTAEVTRAVTFPISFPTACLNVTVTDINPTAGQKTHHDMFSQVNQGSLSTTGFSVFIQGPSGGAWHWVGMYWRAIGH